MKVNDAFEKLSNDRTCERGKGFNCIWIRGRNEFLLQVFAKIKASDVFKDENDYYYQCGKKILEGNDWLSKGEYIIRRVLRKRGSWKGGSSSEEEESEYDISDDKE